MKKFVIFLALLSLMVIVFAQGTLAKDNYEIATVPKVSGVSWFDRMKEGVQQFASDTGYNAYQVGPEKASAALQVKIVEDLIAKNVDAICIVPFSVEAVEPVLKKAREKGIVVISHEGSNLKNCDYDIEAFKNEEYGAKFMDYLAELMGNKGQYAAFVGSLTSKSHNEWVDGALARKKAEYPDVELVTERLETHDNQNQAYKKTRELIKTYPKLSGIEGSCSTDAPGAGLAIEELGLEDEISVVGTSLPSQSKQYLKTGAVDVIGFWDPGKAGYAMNKIAVRVLEGKKVGNGTDLGLDGYHNLKTDDGKVLYGKAWVFITKDNMDEMLKKYDF